MARCNVISFDAHAIVVAGVLEHQVKHRTSSKAMKARCMNEMKYFSFCMFVDCLSLWQRRLLFAFPIFESLVLMCFIVSLVFECVHEIMIKHRLNIEQRNIDTCMHFEADSDIFMVFMFRNFRLLLAVGSSFCWNLSFWVSAVSDENWFFKLAITKWNSFVQFIMTSWKQKWNVF